MRLLIIALALAGCDSDAQRQRFLEMPVAELVDRCDRGQRPYFDCRDVRNWARMCASIPDDAIRSDSGLRFCRSPE